jgi:octaprenyl-diphosphate synthase
LNQQQIFQLIAPELQQVEAELQQQSESHISLIRRIGQYLHESGGKRLRPAILLLSSRLCDFQGPEAVRFAAVIELIHTATLVHDDIIDNADLRRGRPSVNARWDNGITVLMGDWLLMTSVSLALEQKDLRAMEMLTHVVRHMIEGEFLQRELIGRLDVSEEQHLEISDYKTACLFSACAGLGAILGDKDQERLTALVSYGRNLGLAFQLADDLLDFISQRDVLGKPVAHDLHEGRITLPIIYLLKSGDPGYKGKVEEAIRENGRDSKAKNELVHLLKEHHALERTRDKALEYAAKAREDLSGFPDSEARDALLSLTDLVVNREN